MKKSQRLRRVAVIMLLFSTIELSVQSPTNYDPDIGDVSNPNYIRDFHGRRRVKKVLPPDSPDYDEAKQTQRRVEITDNNIYKDKAESHSQVLRRSKRVSDDVPTSTKLVMFPILALSEGLLKIFGAPSSKNSATADQHELNSETKDSPSNPNLKAIQIQTRANMTGHDLKHYHSTLLHGVKKFCPKIAENYKNMLKTVDTSILSKISQIQSQLSSQSFEDSKLHTLIRNISKCVKAFPILSNENIKKASSESQPVHSHKYNLLLAQIHKNLNDEGKRLRSSAQLDTIPNSINLVRFEKLSLQMVTIFCSESSITDQDLKNENSRAGSLLLSVIESTPAGPSIHRPTIHQNEMDELIEVTRECLTSQIQRTRMNNQNKPK